MNRRSMLGLLGAAPLALVGMTQIRSIDGKRISADVVKAGSLSVHSDLGGLKTFEFEMMRGPWPEVWQSIEIKHGNIRLQGRVERVEIREVCLGHFSCRVSGVATIVELPGFDYSVTWI